MEDTSIPPERDELVERPARVVSEDEVEALRLEQERDARPSPLVLPRAITDAEAEAIRQELDKEMRYARITLAPSMYQVEQHLPRRGSDVEAWLKRRRDEWAPNEAGVWPDAHHALDGLLDEYRRCADYGLPLNASLEGTDGV